MNGERYPPKTLFQLMAGLFRHAHSIDPNYPNFLDPKEPQFKGLQGTMDNCFRKLRQDGVGAEIKHTAVILPHEEDIFWDCGILGTSSSS